MLALRLTRDAHPAVQLRRLLVTAASAGTAFLLLCALGYAMGHPGSPGSGLLRLAWCAPPLAATVYFAVAVARTDPGTKPRPGLSAIGLGPLRLMAVSATTTALSGTLGSMLALLFFLHLRGDLTGMPFDGAAADYLAAGRPLPLPGALTLLAVVPLGASIAVALTLRPREAGPAPAPSGPTYGRFGAYRRTSAPETFGTYGRFGRQIVRPTDNGGGEPAGPAGSEGTNGAPASARTGETVPATATAVRSAGAAVSVADEPATHREAPDAVAPDTTAPPAVSDAALLDAPTAAPSGLPWGIAVVTAGLAVETYTSRTAPTPPDLTFSGAAPGVLLGWALAAVGLALAGPGLTHLCGRLLQAARPGALRLLAGRVLMAEATRLGRPLGVVCAVLAAAYAMASLHGRDGLSLGPLTTLGVVLVTGCTVATLLTAAVEARQTRTDTTAALVRLGAPATMLRGAALLRAGALLALFGPLTLTVAELAALPLAH
ncbi:conserved hypothetical protein [Streptomyces viridochromogenes DSM 40736]|uniref:Uncharacterized protein n=1 Tax=Streptomyces viridochromogenes (strain DSM 40736 / JCM 4977 / BCRC 1201 / Tue 494) TaxID=591159 RepID=D9XJ53_STRVT|nr:hypothetical protein [Streptomyces viridochromogenes]EFL35168.1 conserved hypothetical protein [Streptomyces viridochromogenes DSM 40736]